MSLRLWCFALMLLACLVLSGCSPTAETQLDEQKNPHYLAGKEKLSAMDYKGAVESFERALEDNPRSALAHFELGVLFDQHENDYAAALYHYNKTLKLRPNDYPADNVRQRIPACKQELVKADSLAVLNPSAPRETDRLRDEIAALKKQVGVLQAQLAGRPLVPAAATGTRDTSRSSGAPTTNNAASPIQAGNDGAARRTASGNGDAVRSTTTAGTRARTHTVKAGETPFSIARQYRVKLDTLLGANPGLDPKRLRAGQSINIPVS